MKFFPSLLATAAVGTLANSLLQCSVGCWRVRQQRQTLFILLFSNLLAVLSTAQKQIPHTFDNIPKPLLEGANAIMRDEKITFKVSEAGKAEMQVHQFKTILNKDSEARKFYVSYDKFVKISKLEIRIYDAAGKFVREAAKDEITDHSAISTVSLYDDNRVKIVDLHYSDFPFTIEVFYKQKYDGIQTYPKNYFQVFGEATERASFEISVPNAISLRHQSTIESLQPKITSDAAQTNYFWEMENLPVLKPEPFGIRSADQLPQVTVAPSLFAVENFVGSMDDWATFGSFLTKLNENRDEISPETRVQIRKICATQPDDRSKVAALYKFLQENFRYVSVQLGIGGWQTYPAEYVEKKKFGDCKALSNFMKGMLREAGIAANLVAISGGDDGFFEPQDTFVNPAFNHMILYLPSLEMFLECTSQTNPAGYLGSFTEGRKALLCDGERSRLIVVPPLVGEKNREENHLHIQLQSSGEAQLQWQSKQQGERQEVWRGMKLGSSPAEFDKFARERCPIKFSVLEKYTCETQPDTPVADLSFSGNVRKFGVLTGARMFVPLNPYNQFKNFLPRQDDRKTDLIHRLNFIEIDSVSIEIPIEFAVESLPKEVVLSSDFGQFSVKISAVENKVICIRNLVLKPVNLPANRFNEVFDFYKKIESADNSLKCVLLKKG